MSALLRKGLSVALAAILVVALLYTFMPALLGVPPIIEWTLFIYEPDEHAGFGESYATRAECEAARSRMLQEGGYAPRECNPYNYWIPKSANDAFPDVGRGLRTVSIALPFVLYAAATAWWGLSGAVAYLAGLYLLIAAALLSAILSTNGGGGNERIHDAIAPSLTFYLAYLGIIALLG